MHRFLEEKKTDFNKAVDFLTNELFGVRTGRANIALVDNMKVTAYDQTQELKNLASISTPDSTTIQIEPWDVGVVKAIEKAIIEANLGMSPNVSGKTIRLSIPPLTEDTRKELAKVVGKKVEEARISVRNIRDDIKKEIERLEKENEIGEDERYQMQDELDKLVKDINEKLEAMGKEKEGQIMEV